MLFSKSSVKISWQQYFRSYLHLEKFSQGTIVISFFVWFLIISVGTNWRVDFSTSFLVRLIDCHVLKSWTDFYLLEDNVIFQMPFDSLGKTNFLAVLKHQSVHWWKCNLPPYISHECYITLRDSLYRFNEEAAAGKVQNEGEINGCLEGCAQMAADDGPQKVAHIC